MKSKIIILSACLLSASAIMAMPAYRGWQTKTQPDGTTIQVRLNGDEYAHYYTNQEGEIIKLSDDGYWRTTNEQPEQVIARRNASPKYVSRPRKVGDINLAPRGLFILVNFKDTKYQASNTQAEMNNMMNADTYTYDGSYGSARKYFIDQSNGAYSPIFDVVGPVTLTKDHSYYGKNDSNDDDMYPGDMIIEACKLADTECGVDFTQYDNDNDGEVDFVYIIYAGKGEADGGATTTIWPHNWDIESAIYYKNCTYKWSECKVDGLYINNYACSGELNGKTGKRNGIGTLCHEFSHVLGLPDYYDTDYGTNYKYSYTPEAWDIMDYGGYNNEGNCPAGYSIHEKYFFGWATPVNPGSTPQILKLNSSDKTNYNAYQINTSGTLQEATYQGVNYYIENRQQAGWDQYLPGHGLLVWYVNYDQSIWQNNTPNNTAYSPRYTLISATGSKKNLGTEADAYPGTKSRTTWNTISTKPISQIIESDEVISLVYISNPIANTWNYEVVYENCAVSSDGGTVTKGGQLQLTIVPENGYIINSSDHLDVTMGGTTLALGTDYTFANNTLTIPSVTGDVEILVIPATTTAKPYTVQWIADDELLEEQGYEAGEALRLPDIQVIACEGLTFVGWTAQKEYYDPFTLPADIFSTPSEQVVNSNLIFYAIYQQ